MARDIEKSIDAFCEDVSEAAGEDLRAIVLYGSAATGDYVPRKSDLNFLIVVGSVSRSLLSAMQKKAKSWSARGISTPILVDEKFLPSSTDSYPLEILGMMAGYKVLRGEDPVGSLAVRASDVRLQVEREVKVKTLLLQRGYLESHGNCRALCSYLAGVTPAIEAILRGLVFARGGSWKGAIALLRQASAATIGIDTEILESLRALRAGTARPNADAAQDLYFRTLGLFGQLSVVAEGMGV